MGLDWQERINWDRLRKYRLDRARARMKAHGLGAMLLMYDENVRYVTSTHIGEWARDKLSRWVLLTRGGDPILWDFGSAAMHHKLYSPWLKPENCKAGLVGLALVVRSLVASIVPFPPFPFLPYSSARFSVARRMISRVNSLSSLIYFSLLPFLMR